MNTNLRAAAIAIASVVAAALAPSAPATELLFSTGWSNWTFSESMKCASSGIDLESADDFDLVATIERVNVNGYNSCIAVCLPPPLLGARVRFYEWTPDGPGAVLSDQFVAGDDPALAYDPNDIADVEVTLPTPFAANGKHYLSVQLLFDDCFFWAYWIANKDAPIGGAAYRRTGGGGWAKVTGFQMASCDLSYSLFGTVGPPEPPQGCGVWFLKPSPNAPGMQDNWLRGMSYLGPNDIWAVGSSYGHFTITDFNRTTLAMHFDGDEWTIVPTPNPTAAPELTYCELNAVAALAPDDVWAAGTRVDTDGGAGYVGLHNLVLHWDGDSWSQMDAPIPPSFGLQGVSGDGIYEILALSANDIWFFGEWITLDEQGFTDRFALAMHWNGSDFTLHPTPIVGGNGATIYAADAAGPDDIWAAGAAGDGDSATTNFSYIYHWDGRSWSHVPFTPAPGYWHSYGGVKVLGPNDVWISGSAWAPPNTITNFMIHWNGSGWEYQEVPFAGGPIVGEPPLMHVFGAGGVSVFDGIGFEDAHLGDGLEFLSAYGFSDIVQTGDCEMLAVGSKWLAGNAKTLVAELVPIGGSAGAASPDIDGDGDVDGSDLGELLGAWDSSTTWADFDGNGTVDGSDLGTLLGAWTG